MSFCPVRLFCDFTSAINDCEVDLTEKYCNCFPYEKLPESPIYSISQKNRRLVQLFFQVTAERFVCLNVFGQDFSGISSVWCT